MTGNDLVIRNIQRVYNRKVGEMMDSKDIDLGDYTQPDTYGKLMDYAMDKISNPEEKVYFRMAETDLKLTYSEFYRNVNSISNFFSDLGIEKGDHIAVFLQNCVEYDYLIYAFGKLGAVMCPLNPHLKGESLKYIINDSDSRFLVNSQKQFKNKISKISDSLTKVETIIFTDESIQTDDFRSGLLSRFREYPSSFEADQKVSGRDIHGIWYTSGTTGLPKGCVITHCNYLYRTMFYADYFRLKSYHTIYYILPMYHVAYAIWGGPLAVASTSEIVQVPWFSASKFWPHINSYDSYIVFSTGTIIPIMLKRKVTEEEIEGKKKLKNWVAWPLDNPDQVKKRFPDINFIQTYGTTEVPIVTVNDFDDPDMYSSGPLAPYAKLKICDTKNGEELPKTETGEIVCGHKLGSDYIIKEYYNKPEKTSEKIKDGWWFSGDLGRLDEDGHLHFVDRIDDYMRVVGENVSSKQIEEIIRTHEKIKEVAVVGIKGELDHDEIIAHVIAKGSEKLPPDRFFEFCKENMAYYMVPRYLVFKEEFPKTASKRIQKHRLREEGIPPDSYDREELGIELQR